MRKAMRLASTLSNKQVFVGFIIVAFVLFSLMQAARVGAVSDIAPDSNDHDGETRIWMEVSKYGSLNGLEAATSTVTIYSKVPNPIITIIDPHFCRRDPVTSPDRPDSFGSDASSSVSPHTTFSFSAGTPSTPTVTAGGVSTGGEAEFSCPGGGSPGGIWTTQMSNLPPASSAEGLEDYYKTSLTAIIATDYQQVNAFKVRTSSGFVSYTSSAGYKFALQRRGGIFEGGEYAERDNFNLYFATPCNIPAAGETATLSWFDADQNNLGQTPADYGYRLYERDRGSTDPWVINHSLNSEAALGKEGIVDGVYYPKSKTFTAEPDKDYRWLWYGVTRENGIQFQLPYDSIFSKVTCFVPDWDIEGEITVEIDDVALVDDGTTPTAAPGDKIDWNYIVKNTGATSTGSEEVRSYSDGDGFGIAAYDAINNDNERTYPVYDSADASTFRTFTNSYTIQATDAGKTLCKKLVWNPIDEEGNGPSDVEKCVYIPFLHDLDPQKPIGLPLTALPDTELTGIGATVKNNGHTISPSDTKAAVVRFVVPSPTDPATVGGSADLSNNDNYLCKIAQAIMSWGSTPSLPGCNRIGDERVDSFDALVETTILTNGADNLADLAAAGVIDFGDYVCYASVVNNYSPSKGDLNWLYSEPSCVAIKKTPTVHVWGNDVRVGSALESVDNLYSKIESFYIPGAANRYFGSWSEYGAIAPAHITGFASGSGLFADGGSEGSSSSDQQNWSDLTFANNNSPSFGNFVSDTDKWRLGTLPHIEDWTFYVDHTIEQDTTYKLDKWPDNNKRTIVIRAPTVNITKDIVVPNSLKTYGNVSDMPQLIIIADNIRIKAKKVTQIDAWLIAAETINTCGLKDTASDADLNDSPHTNQCDDQLIINGPVVAKNLLLFRTHGAESIATLNEPAETINFSADSYVWARHQAEQSGGLRTVAIRELPPRF